jgi:uncharacterized membrane protein YfcA
MNALAGGGTFATLPALVALGLPANVANATSNVALLPGAAASAAEYRSELEPVGDFPIRWLSAITFAGGIVGSLFLVLTPTRAFDFIIPWLLLIGLIVMLFGKSASSWLHDRVTIGVRALVVAQSLLAIYGGYFGGGVGLMLTATYGLLAGAHPRSLFSVRTWVLSIANFAAAIVFIAAGLVRWAACLPMLVGAVLGGSPGAKAGKRLPEGVVRAWTLFVTAATTIVFFMRPTADRPPGWLQRRGADGMPSLCLRRSVAHW